MSGWPRAQDYCFYADVSTDHEPSIRAESPQNENAPIEQALLPQRLEHTTPVLLLAKVAEHG